MAKGLKKSLAGPGNDAARGASGRLRATPLTLGAGTTPDPYYLVAQFTTDLAALRRVAQDIHKSEQKHEDLETIDAVLGVGQPPEFHTGSLLGTPGAIISMKVYAVTADGRESDSQALSVQRPSG